MHTRIIRATKNHVMDLVNSGSYRGKRHQYGLPVRGQRTRTNAGTMKHLRLNGKLWYVESD